MRSRGWSFVTSVIFFTFAWKLIILSTCMLYSPYVAHNALKNECPYFPGKGEIVVYLGHLIASLRFSIDPDLLTILEYYYISSCRYSPASIGCMMGFLPLLHWKGHPFSLNLFHYFFRVRVLGSDGFSGIGACQNKKLIREIPRMYRNWHTQIFFLKAPSNFYLPPNWKNHWKGDSETP